MERSAVILFAFYQGYVGGDHPMFIPILAGLALSAGLASVRGRGGDLGRHGLCCCGAVWSGHRPCWLRWSCETSTMTVRGSDDRRSGAGGASEKAGEGDFLRSVAEAVLQMLMEADVEGLVGAGGMSAVASERPGAMATATVCSTRGWDLCSCAFRSCARGATLLFLEARKVSEKALVAVIQEAWIGGVSTRRVDDLVQAMGLSGISKSQVSKLCKDIDERVHAFLDRPLVGEWPICGLTQPI